MFEMSDGVIVAVVAAVAGVLTHLFSRKKVAAEVAQIQASATAVQFKAFTETLAHFQSSNLVLSEQVDALTKENALLRSQISDLAHEIQWLKDQRVQVCDACPGRER